MNYNNVCSTFKVEAGYFSGFGTWGCQPTLGVPSLLLSPSLSLSLFPSFPPEAGGGGVLCESWEVLTPPSWGGVENSLGRGFGLKILDSSIED